MQPVTTRPHVSAHTTNLRDHGPGEVTIRTSALDHRGRVATGSVIATAGAAAGIFGLSDARTARLLNASRTRGVAFGFAGAAAATIGIALVATNLARHDKVVTQSALATNFASWAQADNAAREIDRNRLSDQNTNIRQTTDGTFAVVDGGRTNDF